MKCQVCGQRDATIHYVEVAEGKKTQQWICEECASKDGIAGVSSAISHGGLESFLGGMSGHFDSIDDVEQPIAGPVCGTCGYQFLQLQETGLLGCADCYLSFWEHIQPILHRFHREVSHVGKAPRGHGAQAELRQHVATMRNSLARAVGREDYEEAARLRDAIDRTKRQIEFPEADSVPPEDTVDKSDSDPEPED